MCSGILMYLYPGWSPAVESIRESENARTYDIDNEVYAHGLARADVASVPNGWYKGLVLYLEMKDRP